MAALDFPSSPSNGQLYPNPAVAGQPQYTYDGEKWTGGAGVGNVYISDSPPAAPAGSLWYESDTGMLYVRYYDGDSTQWVAIPGGPSDVVRYGVQALTAAQATQARSNIYAAPLDALAYSGMQINGSFEISQELGATATTGTVHVCDGWRQYYAGGIAVSSATAATSPAPPPGFSKYIYVFVTTGKPSLAAGDLCMLFHSIEGYRVSKLGWGGSQAQPITIGFWTCNTKTGIFPVTINNGDSSRSYVATYTQVVSNVWEYHTVTVPGDITGTWATDNSIGMYVTFALAAGSTATTPTANTWVSGNFKSAAGCVNSASANADVLRLTGVVVLPGIESPTAARSPLIMRPYGEELVTCQRYWEKGQHVFDQYMTAGNISSAQVLYKVTKRATPTTITVPAIPAGFSAWGVDSAPSRTDGFKIYGQASATAQATWSVTWTADARL